MSSTPSPTRQREVLTVAEAATVLRVNHKTLYAAIAADEVPGVQRIGRAIRLHRETLLHWIRQGAVPTTGGARP